MSGNEERKGSGLDVSISKGKVTVKLPKRIREGVWFIGNEFQHGPFSEDLMTKYKFLTIPDTEEVYVYKPEKGIYSPIGERVIKSEVVRVLGKEEYKRHYTEVLHYIQAKTYARNNGEIDEEFRERLPNKIATLNCVLNMDTMSKEEFSPNYFLTVQIPVTYNPETKCPKIFKFLEEVVGKEQMNVIQEWFGFCLYLDYFLHKAIMLVGEGRNGKSTLINLLERLLGKRTVSHEKLQDLCNNRFSPSQLFGKLGNLCADIPGKELGNTGPFKMLTGGDRFPAQRKFKDPFYFKNFAKLMFSGNKVPKTLDETTAFFSRWIIISCNNTFLPGYNANPKILEEICTDEEMSGLLNWSLEGLKRLKEKGDFSENRTFEELKERYVKASNPIEAYVDEHLIEDQENFVTKDDLYQNYREYCLKNHLPIDPKQCFAQHLSQYITVKVYYPKIDGKQIMSWSGIKAVKDKRYEPYEPFLFNRKIITEIKNTLKEAGSLGSSVQRTLEETSSKVSFPPSDTLDTKVPSPSSEKLTFSEEDQRRANWLKTELEKRKKTDET